ncbi:MAG: hypothetical protein EOP04_19690 [Proteobacteria bacterium]|nr:MAG: hypothetical protein EOP04_19690 [Pseudomonadota bacterium]
MNKILFGSALLASLLGTAAYLHNNQEIVAGLIDDSPGARELAIAERALDDAERISEQSPTYLPTDNGAVELDEQLVEVSEALGDTAKAMDVLKFEEAELKKQRAELVKAPSNPSDKGSGLDEEKVKDLEEAEQELVKKREEILNSLRNTFVNQ